MISVAWPDITVGAFVILFAAYSFMVAAADGVRAFSGPPCRAGPRLPAAEPSVGGRRRRRAAWPDITALALTLWVGAWALVTGLIEVTLAFRRGKDGRRPAWGPWEVSSRWPSAWCSPSVRHAGAVSLATVFGLFSIVSGISALVLSVQLRRAHTTAEGWGSGLNDAAGSPFGAGPSHGRTTTRRPRALARGRRNGGSSHVVSAVTRFRATHQQRGVRK